MSGEMTTSHELAERLLALPDATVYVEDQDGERYVEVDGAFVADGYVIVTLGQLFIEPNGEPE